MTCWPWMHRWTKWEVTEKGNLRSMRDALGLPIADWRKEPIIGHYILQQRSCERCGKMQIREVQT